MMLMYNILVIIPLFVSIAMLLYVAGSFAQWDGFQESYIV